MLHSGEFSVKLVVAGLYLEHAARICVTLLITMGNIMCIGVSVRAREAQSQENYGWKDFL